MWVLWIDYHPPVTGRGDLDSSGDIHPHPGPVMGPSGDPAGALAALHTALWPLSQSRHVLGDSFRLAMVYATSGPSGQTGSPDLMEFPLMQAICYHCGQAFIVRLTEHLEQHSCPGAFRRLVCTTNLRRPFPSECRSAFKAASTAATPPHVPSGRGNHSCHVAMWNLTRGRWMR